MTTNMDVLAVTLAALNVPVAVWFIRGGRRKFGPGWTAGWAGYAMLDIAAIWWHPAAWLAIACGLVAVVARSRRVRAAARARDSADAPDLTGSPR